MRHAEQIRIGRELLGHIDAGTTHLAGTIYRHNVSDYTCADQLAQERSDLFRRMPLNVGLSCLVPRPGDFLTLDHSGDPILLVRQRDGSLRAFLNVCRHRGAKVARADEGACGHASAFTCPYHAWSYGLDGRLLGRPDERSFPEYARENIRLSELPCVEQDGMIWVAATPGEGFDAHLGPAAEDIRAYGLAGYHHYETRVRECRFNWKVLVDTFLETYHLSTLHTETIHPIFFTNLTTFDAMGRHLRMVGARRTIKALRDLPENEWDVIRHTVIVYVLFPNTVFIVQGDHIETWHVHPAPDDPNRCTMRISLYTPEPAETESARRHWDNNFNLLMRTVEAEDFPVGEDMQRGFRSPAQSHIVFGRNEPALAHFHSQVKDALGLPAS